MAKEFKLNIFDVLAQIDRKNFWFYDQLTEEEQKSLAPVVMVRWLSGTTDEEQLKLLNSICNPVIFSLSSQHKNLMMKLFCCTTNMKPKRYTYKNTLSKKQSKTLKLKVVSEYFAYSYREAEMVLPNIKSEDFVEMAMSLGWDDKEIKALKKEL
jgi:hypothetical protein